MRASAIFKSASLWLGASVALAVLLTGARAADSVGTLSIRSQGYFYVGGRYNTLKGQLISKNSADESVRRDTKRGTPAVASQSAW